MKIKHIGLLVMLASILFVAISLTGEQAIAQENLLTNPGFEEGYYNQDGIPEIAVPNGWRMHWLDGQAFNGSNGNAARPETVVWNIKDAPPSEQLVFFKDGSYAFKVFKGWAPVYAALSQDMSGLEVGRKYRMAIPIFIDIVEDYSSSKRPPSKLDSGQIRLGAGETGIGWRDEANIQYSGWWTAGNISPFYLAYPVFIHDFVATAPNMTVWIEMASIDPYINNGFFMDGLAMFALDEYDSSVSGSAPSAPSTSNGSSAPAVAAPPAAPAPTAVPREDGSVIHVVQAGDSFWSLAIQYAETMGISPEEALVTIPALNNNPAFFNPGDELIIVPPGETITVESAAESEAEEETVVEETVEEPTPEAEAPATEEEIASNPIGEAVTETQTTNGVCVIVYEDKDGDAVYFIENENLLPNAAVTLFQDGNTKASYVTDGINEPYCFENLEGGTYQVQVFPPAGYQATTPESWAVAVSNGVIIPVTYGLSLAPQEVADAGTTEVTSENPDAGSESGNETAESETAVTPEDSSGGIGNISGLLLIGAAFVVLLAGAGVFLLRRG